MIKKTCAGGNEVDPINLWYVLCGGLMKFKMINDKSVFYIDNGCNVEEYLKNGQLYGEGDARLLNSLVRDLGNGGDTILDCGAHIGTFALPMVSFGYKVVCVEAATENVECLRMTFSDIPQVEVVEAIVMDEVKECSFSRTNGPFGWVEAGTGRKSSTIDEICSGKKISGIKMDIEGAEIFALKGAKKTLERKPPMIMEVNGFCLMQHKHTCEDLLKEVESFGYNIYWILNAPHTGVRVFRLNPDEVFPFGMANIVAIDNAIQIADYLPENLSKQIYENSKVSANNELKKYFDWIENK